jgi:membrane-bound lytic murein transglycosylase B
VIHRLLPLALALLACGPLAFASASHPKNASRHAAPPAAPRYASRPEAMALADEIATRQQLDRHWVRRAIGQAVQLPQVVRLMTPAPTGTPKNWQLYRSRFIEPVRLQAGARFWQTHRETLARAQQQFGVPPEIIVGIIGVETLYGQHQGNFRVIDVLATLAFDFPASHPRAAERSRFFKTELEQLLSLHRHRSVDPLRLRGSYAGAMGMPQFMPSSWVRFAVDFDGDGRIDLFHSTADVIGSVANYFKAFGWQPGQPTHYSVRFDPSRFDRDALLAPDILPTFTVASFSAKGAVLDAAGLQHQGPLALVELQNGEEPPSYVAGTENFYAITRYNWSSYYAMAVIELGRAVATALTEGSAQASTTPSNTGCNASTQVSTSPSPTCR